MICNFKIKEKERSEKIEVEKLMKLYKEALMIIKWYNSKTERYNWKLNDKEKEWLDMKMICENQLKVLDQTITKNGKRVSNQESKIKQSIKSKDKTVDWSSK